MKILPTVNNKHNIQFKSVKVPRMTIDEIENIHVLLPKATRLSNEVNVLISNPQKKLHANVIEELKKVREGLKTDEILLNPKEVVTLKNTHSGSILEIIRGFITAPTESYSSTEFLQKMNKLKELQALLKSGNPQYRKIC